LPAATSHGSTQINRSPAAPPQVAEQKVMRALPSYGTYGGYRYRRFSGDS